MSLVSHQTVTHVHHWTGKLFSFRATRDSAEDRAMLCGSPAMLADTVDILKRSGFTEGSSASPARHAIEKAFVAK